MMLKENKESVNKWKDVCVHGLDNNVAWMSILFRVTCKFNTITIKSQRLFFFVEGKK